MPSQMFLIFWSMKSACVFHLRSKVKYTPRYLIGSVGGTLLVASHLFVSGLYTVIMRSGFGSVVV